MTASPRGYNAPRGMEAAVFLAVMLASVVMAADPQVMRVLSSIATEQGEARSLAVASYVAGCRGKNRFAFRNNKDAMETLRPMFNDEDAKVRAAALGLTVCYGAGTFDQEVISLLEDKDAEVRERAYEEAAHAASAEVMVGLAGQVESCAARIAELGEVDVKWCKFALYGLGETGKAIKDAAVKRRVADLSAPLLRSTAPGLREHALRNLELCGGAAHSEAVAAVVHLSFVTDAERKKAAGLAKTLKKRK
ncbi:MAG: hypothetical protein HY904_02600 [Deltaproteobacteria bacterium]|nr:hypothetical protein [Deltaproteobacteria bacterium]